MCITFSCTTTIIYFWIIQCTIHCFIIHSRVTHYIIIRNRTAVGTPFGIDCNNRFLGISLFGCNQNNTVSTTCTIDRICSSIFQYSHAFDILWIDRRNTPVKRNSIYYIQWRVTCTHRTNTTDTNSCSTTRLTITWSGLYSRNLTSQCIRNIWNRTFSQFISFHSRCRSGKRWFFRCTICYYHYFINHLWIRLQEYSQRGFNCDLLCLHTNKRNLQSFCRTWYARQSKITIYISDGT